MEFESCVRLRISRSRNPTIMRAACCSVVFTGTKRIVGRLIASQSASASAPSFLPRFTYGLTNWGLHLVAERPQKPRQIVGCAAGFNSDHCRRKRFEER